MNEYIYTVVTVTTIGGILISLLPEKSSKIKKQINFIVGLICTLVFISPIIGILSSSQAIKDNISSIVLSIDNVSSSATNEIIVGTSLDKISQGIKKSVINKFNLNEQDVDVRVFISDKSKEVIYIDYVEIILKNGATWTDDNKIKEYIEDLSGCKVKILRL